MNEYTTYLTAKGYAQASITMYTRTLQEFKLWCDQNNTSPMCIEYKTCLLYIKSLTQLGNSKKTINHKLGGLKLYFNYLVEHNYRGENPIEAITVRGVQRTLQYHLLKHEELEDLYYSYQTDNYQEAYHQYTAKRDKTIVGILVYQGIETIDLKQLKLEHLQLHKGSIYIPSRARSNARSIPLQPSQIMGLMEYIKEVRPMLLNRLQIDSDALFPYNKRFTRTYYIIKQLKTYNQNVSCTRQIRASVITHWLSQYNLRKVQYLSGHRYISSTERYLQDDLENLQEIVNQYHPIQ